MWEFSTEIYHNNMVTWVCLMCHLWNALRHVNKQFKGRRRFIYLSSIQNALLNWLEWTIHDILMYLPVISLHLIPSRIPYLWQVIKKKSNQSIAFRHVIKNAFWSFLLFLYDLFVHLYLNRFVLLSLWTRKARHFFLQLKRHFNQINS